MVKLLVLGFAIVLSTCVWAGDGSSGCGLGWQIASKNSLLSSTTRNTTHAILPNTFSMTFGTAGCAKHSIVKNEAKGIHYAEANFHQLMAQMPTGSGEYVNGFAAVLGCEAESFSNMAQKNYERIYAPGATPVTMYQNVITQIKSDKNVLENCRLI